MTTAPDDNVLLELRGKLGIITLNSPKTLNALTAAMCRAIDAALTGWADDPGVAAVVMRAAGERAFCAGGNVRAIYDGRQIDLPTAEAVGHEFFRSEYRMNRRVKTFPKPYIALIDGIIMGGGLGISVHGSHRVATERTLFAMPETALGNVPDVGASYVLPRLAGETGTYLALTGARIKAPELTALGLATHFAPASALGALVDELAAADWNGDAHRVADAIVGNQAVDAPTGSFIAAHRALIDRCFGKTRVEDIFAALEAEGGAFADETLATLRVMSPTSLKLTLEMVRRGSALDFDDCMRMEYRLAAWIVRGHDFIEGIRAVLVDKDRNPKWDPAALGAVDDATVAGYFALPAAGDLTFPA